METRAHMVLIIRAIATSTRMTPDCLTRSQSSRTVAGGPEGATESCFKPPKPQRKESTEFESQITTGG